MILLVGFASWISWRCLLKWTVEGGPFLTEARPWTIGFPGLRLAARTRIQMTWYYVHSFIWGGGGGGKREHPPPNISSKLNTKLIYHLS